MYAEVYAIGGAPRGAPGQVPGPTEVWLLERSANLSYVATETARCEAIASIACTSPNTPTSYAIALGAGLQLTLNSSNIVAPECDPIAGRCVVTLVFPFRPVGAWFPALTLHKVGVASIAGT